MAGAFQLNDPNTASLGDALQQQVQGETDEERRKRMSLLQQQTLAGPAGQLAISSLIAPGGSKAAGLPLMR